MFSPPISRYMCVCVSACECVRARGCAPEGEQEKEEE